MALQRENKLAQTNMLHIYEQSGKQEKLCSGNVDLIVVMSFDSHFERAEGCARWNIYGETVPQTRGVAI